MKHEVFTTEMNAQEPIKIVQIILELISKFGKNPD